MDSFPIFVKLGERPPLVVGGGELAAAKARLLLKSARRVTIAAEQFAPAIAHLIATGAAEPVPSEPGVEQIRNRPLVVSATGDLDEDSRISALARALGVPVNVPDRPELCSFSLAAIVDREGVTVAIGTEGAAPVLATQLRASLERELHPRLGRLAAIAREFRDQVGEKLPAGVRRRDFWDQVFAGPAAAAILAGDEVTGRRLIGELLDRSKSAQPACGRVLLVGAGPGDPELLTLKAVRALKSADVILHDHLIGEGVLEYARREAQIVCVGKKKGRHCKSQAEINALIVSFALEGKTVVRLKGGDPFVFGRGGEEVDVLRSSGIPIEVVPGITAATAAAAILQIPLTHRGVSRSVTFISGHAAGDGRPDFDQIDFRALAASNSTLAVYMGVATAGILAATMLASGWSPATPVIAVERASLANERRVATTLDVLAEDPSRLQLEGPALLICGEVASLLPAGAIEQLRSKRSHTRPREGADA
jgi:uroporphyrin-III C-methyltransferase/precorrin-2 dehydrogenase/sirohydrochlorin ferrochelatase